MQLMKRSLLVSLVMLLLPALHAGAQNTDDDDIFRSLDLRELDYQKQRNYFVRLYGYYRFIDDGHGSIINREYKVYRIYEGICYIDVRYNQEEDDGATVLVGRDLVHPDQKGKFVEYYELKPYTFLEKARRDTKHFTLEEQGDTTRVFTRRGLAGTVVRDTARHELRMSYNALSPDTALNLNLLIVKAHLAHVDAEAVYRIDDNDVDYVPQGNLKNIVFEGDIDLWLGNNTHEIFHERTEIYVDSVAYMSRSEYSADKRLSHAERVKRSGYTDADIDRLRRKYGVPPLTDSQRQRIEEQLDWDDAFEHWRQVKRKDKKK